MKGNRILSKFRGQTPILDVIDSKKGGLDVGIRGRVRIIPDFVMRSRSIISPASSEPIRRRSTARKPSTIRRTRKPSVSTSDEPKTKPKKSKPRKPTAKKPTTKKPTTKKSKPKKNKV